MKTTTMVDQESGSDEESCSEEESCIEENMESDDETYEGSSNEKDEPHGRGTLYFDKEKKEKFHGKFRNGVKEGKGCFYFADGSSLSGNFIDGSLCGKGLYSYGDGSFEVSTYTDGDLNGYSEVYDSEGILTFKGSYIDNMRTGVCHFYSQHDGYLFGLVSKENGQLTGKNIIYAYPDGGTFLKGEFHDGVMISACVASYDGIGNCDNPHSYKKVKDSQIFSKDVSTDKVPSTLPLTRDPYENTRVFVKSSTIADAQEGLFAKINAKANEVMSFYNGIRIPHEEVDGRDWVFNDNTISLDEKIVIDVPAHWSNTMNYCASLGHKANHSFQPNSKYDKFDHPRFGSIKCIRTIKAVVAGEELTVEYGYDHTKLETEAPQWYKNKLKIWQTNQLIP